MKRISGWAAMKEAVNSLENGDTITRKKLHHFIREEKNHKCVPPGTIDQYVLHLKAAAILQQAKRGTYRKNHSIPDDMTTSELYQMISYFRRWKQWFISLEDKLKMIRGNKYI